jgi:hypothetical protein
VFAGGIASAAAALVLATGSAPAPRSGERPTQNLQVAVADAEDPRWELTRVELLLDGESLASIEVPSLPPTEAESAAPTPNPQPASPRTDGVSAASRVSTATTTQPPPRPLWSGEVPAGPHHLAALLFFRARKLPGASDGITDLVRVETRTRSVRLIHPLVLLITPVRPTPAPLDTPPELHVTIAPQTS